MKSDCIHNKTNMHIKDTDTGEALEHKDKDINPSTILKIVLSCRRSVFYICGRAMLGIMTFGISEYILSDSSMFKMYNSYTHLDT